MFKSKLKLLCVICALGMEAIVVNTALGAITLQGGNNQFSNTSLCKAYFDGVYESKNFTALRAAKSQNGNYYIFVLGMPKLLKIDVNGMDAKPYFVRSQDLICSGKRAGEIRIYNFEKATFDAAILNAKADRHSTSIHVNK